MTARRSTPVALVTGGSRGLGRALVHDLLDRGSTVVTDGRDPATLAATVGAAGAGAALVTVPGDQAEPVHRAALRAAVEAAGGLDLLVLNAGALGPSPLPALAALTDGDLRAVLDANVVAPAAVARDLLDLVRASHGTIVAVTSDAAVAAYPGWGAYGASKAALAHWARVLGAEEPDVSVLVVDPGDLRTDMHQAAFPGEDISDRTRPEDRAPGLVDQIAAGAHPEARHPLRVVGATAGSAA